MEISQLEYINMGFVLRSTLLQCIIFSFIPFIWWLLRARKQISFIGYVGLKKPEAAGRPALYGVPIYAAVWILTHLPPVTQYTQPSSSIYLGLGTAALLPMLTVSFIQQGLAEEVLFRGFIAKRLIGKFGFQAGNLAQAGVFAAIHIVFGSNISLFGGTVIFVTTFIGGYMLGYLSEKAFGGSIITGILLHGLGNFIINMIQAFS